jgi:hypothetical protein
MLNQMRSAAQLDMVRKYLHDTLGVACSLRPWTGKFPYYLQDSFELHELKILDHSVLLAVNRRAKAPPLATVRDRLEKLKALTDRPVVYVTAALASYERRRLIEQKVPFIVPGNQLYLPDLGLDLREYFRQQTQTRENALGPATQAMLIKGLLEISSRETWSPAAIAADLGYTPMTLSRAVKELTAAGIATIVHQGKARWLHMDRAPAETWEVARPLLRSPVKREVWAQATVAFKKRRVPLAGLSALARYSHLIEPALPVYAMSASELKALSRDFEVLPEPQPDACQLQVWSYTPILAPNGKNANVEEIVDPMSLTLSLQETTDERIELALEELKKHFPW